MFIYNDNDLDNVSLTFTERENGLEFYVEGYDEDNKISIDFMLDLIPKETLFNVIKNEEKYKEYMLDNYS